MNFVATNPWTHCPRFVARGRLLLAFVRLFGSLPSSPAILARLLGCSRETARADRDALLDETSGRAWLAIGADRDARLRLTEEAVAAFEREEQVATAPGSYVGPAILPTSWFIDCAIGILPGLEGAKKSSTWADNLPQAHLTRAELLAAAELIADAERCGRDGVRGDRERGTAAAVDRALVASARWKLVRARLMAWRPEWVGRLVYHRVAPPGTAGFESTTPDEQCTEGRVPRNPAAKKSGTSTAKKVGTTHSEMGIPVHPYEDGSGASETAAVTRKIVTRLAREKSIDRPLKQRQEAAAARAAIGRVQQLACDRCALEEILEQSPRSAIDRALDLAGYLDRKPDIRRAEAAKLAARGVTGSDLLRVVFDALLVPEKRSIGALLVHRVRQMLGGRSATSVIDRQNQDLGLGELADRVRDTAPESLKTSYATRKLRVRQSEALDPATEGLVLALRSRNGGIARRLLPRHLMTGAPGDARHLAGLAEMPVADVESLLAPTRSVGPGGTTAESA